MYLTKEQVRKAIENRPEGTSPEDVINAFVSQGVALEGWEQSAKKSVGQKLAGGDYLKGPSQFLFGSTGKAVGGLITTGIGSAQQLAGTATGNKELQEKGTRLRSIGEEAITPMNVAMTGLELYPGGGALTRGLKKLPGGKAVIGAISKLPDKLKATAIKQYSGLFNATTQKTKALTEKVAPKLLEKGKIIASADALQTEALEKTVKLGSKIDNWFKGLPAGAKETVSPILKDIQKRQSQYMVGKKVVNEAGYNALEKIKKDLTTQTGEMATKNLRKLRQIWDKHYDVSKGIDDIASYTKEANRVGADAIRNLLAKKNPDLAKLNKEFSFWRGVADLATETAKKQTLKGSVLGSVAGGSVGYKQGGGFGALTGMTVGAIAGKSVINLMRSPAWNSVSAVAKNNLADALMSGGKETIELAVSKIISGSANLLRKK
jgi:hypothetical protein